jgi:nitrite reductase/ring-hydroxylating ferredoxin subunit/uncharacterized membrane protein
MATAPAQPKAHALVHALGEVEAIDPPAKAAGKAVRGAIPHGAVKDVLSGVPIGHALHPLLTDVVIGTWTSASILDVVGGRGAQPAAERLIAIGLAAAVPTAVSGSNDWADTEVADPEVRRVGAVHAVLNVAALGLYGASLAARRADRRGWGRALGFAGAGLLGVSGHLGGHLSYGDGVGVDQNTWEPAVEDWTDAAADADVREGELTGATVAGVDVVLTRRDGRLHALADRCAHRGGPLHRGQLVDGCVECPWHGSRFALEDGSVERGPSPYPQPVFEARARDGRVEVRRAAGRP